MKRSIGEDTGENNASVEVFRFKDLPPELRNKIYGILLTSEYPIKITRHRNRRTRKQAGGAWTYLDICQSLYKVKGTIKPGQGKRTKRRSIDSVHSIALLRVSKEIHAEAAPIFYGLNKFIFESVGPLKEFTTGVKLHKGFLADIELKSHRSSRPLDLVPLWSMSLPRNIVIPVNGDVESAAKDVWRAIRPIVTFRSEFNPHYDILDALERKFRNNWPRQPIENENEKKARFECFNFNIDASVSFKSEGVEMKIEDAKQRSKLFKAAVLSEWVGQEEREAKRKNLALSHAKQSLWNW